MSRLTTFARAFCLALIIELILLLVVAVSGLMLAGYRLAAVQSGSMTPTFSVGDAIITRPVSPQQLKVGDVISFASSEKQGAIVSHRLIAVQAAAHQLVTKGDNLHKADTPIPYQAVRRQVVAVVPWLGVVIDAAHRPLGLTVIGTVLFSVAAYECYRLGKVQATSVYRLTAYKVSKV